VLVLGGTYLALNVALVLPSLGTELSDFTFYHQAGSAILQGRSPFVVPSHDYPPLLSFLVAPFAALAYSNARLAWFIVSQLLIVMAGAWTVRALGGRRRDILTVATTWTAAGSVAITLREGQVNALLLLLLCIAFWPPRGSGRWRAWMIGAAAALKVWPGVLVLGDLIHGRLRRALGTMAVALTLVAVPLVVIAAFLQGRALPPHTGYWMGTPAFLNNSLPAVVLRVLDPPTKGAPLPVNWIAGHNTETLNLPSSHLAASVAVAVVVLLSGFGLVSRAVRRARQAVDPAAVDAALVAIAILAGPIAWTHYQLLQLPGAARLGRDLWDRRRWAELGSLVAAFLAANWTEAVARGPYLAQYGTTAGSVGLVWLLSSVPTVASVALFTLHLRRLRHPGGRQTAR
jgi:alpha-1,2-mannosyltransferase